MYFATFYCLEAWTVVKGLIQGYDSLRDPP